MKTWSRILIVGMIAAFVSSGATAFAQTAGEVPEVTKEAEVNNETEVKKEPEVKKESEVKKEAEVRKEPEAKKEEPNWSIGAGVCFSSYSLGYVSNLSTLSTGLASTAVVVNAPLGNIFVERRLNRSFALLLKLEGTYRNDENAYSDSNQGGLGLATGARWILNPGGFVELSLYSIVGGDWSFGKTTFKTVADYHTHFYGYDIGLGVGLAVEMRLLANLYLRFESLVGKFGYQYSKQEGDGNLDGIGTLYGNGNWHNKSIYALLAFSPTIELRMAF
jgi:hypothetical protein